MGRLQAARVIGGSIVDGAKIQASATIIAANRLSEAVYSVADAQYSMAEAISDSASDLIASNERQSRTRNIIDIGRTLYMGKKLTGKFF